MSDGECAGDQFVYVICHRIDGRPSGPCKVGVSRDVNKRLAALQTGNPHKLMVAASYMVTDALAGMVEQSFHDLQPGRMAGEWFDMDPYAAARMVALHCHVLLRFVGFTFEEVKSFYPTMGLDNKCEHLRPEATPH